MMPVNSEIRFKIYMGKVARPFHREFTIIECRDRLAERVPDATNCQCSRLRATAQHSGQNLLTWWVIYQLHDNTICLIPNWVSIAQFDSELDLLGLGDPDMTEDDENLLWVAPLDGEFRLSELDSGE